METEAGLERAGALAHPIQLGAGLSHPETLTGRTHYQALPVSAPSWALGTQWGTRRTGAAALLDSQPRVGEGRHIKAGSQKHLYMNVDSGMIYSS